MESHGLRFYKVFDEKMKPRTPSITCISCQNCVHLKKYAELSFRKANKLNEKFNCSKCSASEIQHAINYERLKQKNMAILPTGFVPESCVTLIF